MAKTPILGGYWGDLKGIFLGLKIGQICPISPPISRVVPPTPKYALK